MKLPPTFRADALGVIVALALTAGAASITVGPRTLSHAPTHAEQLAELESQRKEALEVDRKADAARRACEALSSQAVAAVQLKPANTINQRLGEMALMAEPGGVSLASIAPVIAAPAPVDPKNADARAAEARATLVPIRLSGSATYPDLARFLHALHDTFRDTAVSSCRVTAQNQAAGSEKTLASFTIDLAWYAAPAASEASSPKP